MDFEAALFVVGEEVESVAAMVVDVDGLLLARSNVAIICGGCQKSCLVEELCSRGVALVNVGIGSYCVRKKSKVEQFVP